MNLESTDDWEDITEELLGGPASERSKIDNGEPSHNTSTPHAACQIWVCTLAHRLYTGIQAPIHVTKHLVIITSIG